MDFSKILPAVEAAAPTIAGLLGGPLASMGVQALEGLFGLAPGTSTKDPQVLATAVAGMTPDQAIALAKIDADLKAKLIDGGISYENVAAADRNSARMREMSVKDWTPRLLALGVTLGFFGLLTLLVFHQAPDASRDLLNIMCGSLGAGWLAVVSYYFGSSAGSAKKDETITALSK